MSKFGGGVVEVSDDYEALRIVEVSSSRLALIGELDIAGVAELEARVAELEGDVALECSRLTFVDASGLGLFVRIRNASEARGVNFTIVEPSRCLVRVLTVTGLDAVFLNGRNGSRA